MMDSDWLNVFIQKCFIYLNCYHSYRPWCEWTKDMSSIEELYFLVMMTSNFF